MSIAQVFRPLALAVTLLAGASMAAFPQANEEMDDPPGRVGRLSHMDGSVSFRDTDTGQWVPATLNFPVTSGAEFWTEPKSRAEIQIASAALRLDQMTAIRILRLDDAATQIHIDQGSINLRLRELPPGGVRLLTQHSTVVINAPGRYHVDVAAPQGSSASDHTHIAVLEGAAVIEGLATPLIVNVGHSATIRSGEAYPLLAQAIALPLDIWSLERDGLLTPSQTQQYVSPDMTGMQELDNYGQWASEPVYGPIWYPRSMAADWAPYRYGHWAYLRPWGWTWIDHQPWGFAPFHYGRWIHIHNRWGWHPGHRAHRPIYAPALVIFASGSSAVLLASGKRSPVLGWSPLGLHDVYRPLHHHSPRYAHDANIAHVNIGPATTAGINRNTDHESSRGLRNRDGLTVVAAESFTGAMAVDKTRMRLRDNEWLDARRAESLDHLLPSRSARAGVMAPAVTTTNNHPTAPNAPRLRLRHGDWNDELKATPTIVRPDVLPPAPGPDRNRQQPDVRAPVMRQHDREPNATQLNRSNTPPGRAISPPAEPSRPVSIPDRDVRDSRDILRGRREPAGTRLNGPRDEPRLVEPAPQPRQISPRQSPGTAPNTMAPTRPAPLQASPSIQPNRREGTRQEIRPDIERRREEPRSFAPPPDLSRRSASPQNATPTFRQSPRPDYTAPPQRHMAPQTTERRSPPSVQQSPVRPQESGSRRQETPDQNHRKRPQDGTGPRAF